MGIVDCLDGIRKVRDFVDMWGWWCLLKTVYMLKLIEMKYESSSINLKVPLFSKLLQNRSIPRKKTCNLLTVSPKVSRKRMIAAE